MNPDHRKQLMNEIKPTGEHPERNRCETDVQARSNHERLEFVIDGAGMGTWEWNIQTNQTVFKIGRAHV